MSTLPQNIPRDLPVLIAGPTASGKSALALDIVAQGGGVIINADALQVYDGWNILTARPPEEDLARAQHRLYGHVSFRNDYSVGDWLRDIAPLLAAGGPRPVIVGGTGLYFRALCEGLAPIPATPDDLRATANALRLDGGLDGGLAEMVRGLDPETASRIDLRNPMRVQRAWEVQQATGRGLASWQDDTPAPLLPLAQARPLVLSCDVAWLNARITQRFDLMLAAGALEEAEGMLADWDPAHHSSKAIGACELVAHLRGEISLETARERAIIASRQYAKRQRTWFRKRMSTWQHIDIK